MGDLCSRFTFTKFYLCCTQYWRKSSSNPVFICTGLFYYLTYLSLSNLFSFLTHIFLTFLDNGSWNETIISMVRVCQHLVCAHQMLTYSLFSFISQGKHTIYLDFGTEKNRQLINVSELTEEMDKDWCTLLLCFYGLTDKNYAIAFKGKGKAEPLKKLVRSSWFHNSLRYLFIVYFFHNRFHLNYSTPKNIQ